MNIQFVECRKCSYKAIPQNNLEVCTNEECGFEYCSDLFRWFEDIVLMHEEIKAYLKISKLVNV